MFVDDLPGELSNIDDVNVSECLDCIDNNRDKIVGVKVRLSAQLANNGVNEVEGCKYVLGGEYCTILPLGQLLMFS